jgi:2-polyprenyl-3-methyl-5-hydroxy-6-metoxy-1,4-benzoquinol methylase
MTNTVRCDPEDTETATLLDFADFTDKRVLEIGCGDGRLTWRYAAWAAHVTAIDPKVDDIATAIEDCPYSLRNHVEFRAERLEDFTPPHERFDLALLSWSL